MNGRSMEVRASFDDDEGPTEARRPFVVAMEECRDQLEKLGALVADLERRAAPLRLSVPRPSLADGADVKAAVGDLHSPGVERLYVMRDLIQKHQARLVVLLDELEI